jgi:hypothetical protein
LSLIAHECDVNTAKRDQPAVAQLRKELLSASFDQFVQRAVGIRTTCSIWVARIPLLVGLSAGLHTTASEHTLAVLFGPLRVYSR